MYLIWSIVLLFGIMAFAKVFEEEYRESRDLIDALMVSTIIGFIGGMLGFIVGGALALPFPMDCTYQAKEITLGSLQDGISNKGSFILGCGNVDSEPMYFYYCQNSDNTYSLRQIEACYARIRLVDSAPNLQIISKVPTKKKINWIAYDFGLSRKVYVFNIPKDSIKNNFNLDAN